MPSRFRTLLLAAVLVLSASAGSWASAGQSAGATTSSASAIDGSTTKSYVIPTRDGDVYLEVVHPTSHGALVRAPAVLTYSPYSVLGRNSDAAHWTSHGFARMYADVVGTGNSGGCYDYGGRREQRSGFDIVEWVAKQKWSTGKVGMLGGSYDGTTQYATAITHPPHLTAIVPEAAIAHWYGYAYSGGMRYTDNNESLSHEGPTAASDEGIDTPAGFDFAIAVPPPTDPTDPAYAKRLQDNVVPCDEVSHTVHGYATDPTYDSFWRERDYLPGLRKVTIPVLVASNWGDWNVKQEEGWSAFHALPASPVHKAVFGTRWSGHGVPGGPYASMVDAWFDRWLLGKHNGVEAWAPVTTQTSDARGPLTFGTAPRTHDLELHPRRGVLSAGSQTATETMALLPGTEASELSQPGAAGQLWSVTDPLVHDTRLLGSAGLRLSVTAHQTRLPLAVSLVDVDAADRVDAAPLTIPRAAKGLVAITRGWLDTAYRNGLDSLANLPVGAPTTIEITLKPTDYTIRKGHRIGLLITSSQTDWVAPKPPMCVPADPLCAELDVNDGPRTRLVLPLVSGGS